MNPDNDKVAVYKDAIGEWRWRRWDASNGKTVSDSGEGYHKRAAAYEAAVAINPGLSVEVLD